MMIYHTFFYSLGKNQSPQWQLWEIMTFAEHRKPLILNLKAPYWFWDLWATLHMLHTAYINQATATAYKRRRGCTGGSEGFSY